VVEILLAGFVVHVKWWQLPKFIKVYGARAAAYLNEFCPVILNGNAIAIKTHAALCFYWDYIHSLKVDFHLHFLFNYNYKGLDLNTINFIIAFFIQSNWSLLLRNKKQHVKILLILLQ